MNNRMSTDNFKAHRIDTYIYIIIPKDDSILISDYVKRKIPIKIGISKNVHKRLNQLQVGCFIKLRILSKIGPMTRREALDRERDIHNTFRPYISTGEWFHFTTQDIRALASKLKSKLGPSNYRRILFESGGLREKRSRVLWETLQFRKICRLAAPFITDQLFWDLIEKPRVNINGKNYGVGWKLLKPEDKLTAAISILGDDKEIKDSHKHLKEELKQAELDKFNSMVGGIIKKKKAKKKKNRVSKSL